MIDLMFKISSAFAHNITSIKIIIEISSKSTYNLDYSRNNNQYATRVFNCSKSSLLKYNYSYFAFIYSSQSFTISSQVLSVKSVIINLSAKACL